jgi:hypothetical protein
VLKGNDNKAVHVQILFSTVFMISCSMFSLVLFEGDHACPQRRRPGVPCRTVAVPAHARRSMLSASGRASRSDSLARACGDGRPLVQLCGR